MAKKNSGCRSQEEAQGSHKTAPAPARTLAIIRYFLTPFGHTKSITCFFIGSNSSSLAIGSTQNLYYIRLHFFSVLTRVAALRGSRKKN